MNEALNDIREGALNWRAWGVLATDDLQARYRRTVLGPFWVTIAHAFFVAGYAYWSSAVLKQPLAEAFLYVAAGLTVWAFIASSLCEAPGIFPRTAGFITSYDLPISLQIFRVVLGQVLTLGHNFVVYLAALAFVGTWPGMVAFMAIPGLIVVSLACVSWSFFLSILGARYRDVGPLLNSVVGMLMIMTPVFWRKADIGSATWLAEANPIYHLIELIRAPLLGNMPTAVNWAASLTVVAVCTVISLVAFVRQRRNITYWL
ncbi:teichoic acid translocation permease protein TagG [Candidatus Phycosocius bacilliformis]|uniref:Teichoic acid translocation permease protein TagG n=1 Tax=Candidatus Phycosocius bacilliformis TaxID=1445552 RepID=A0A2P2E6F7_9PROT|nr:ABC transporter permease [Candidatus Phycosocius bacilliformis]GBF56654.1 teichoic acid translocation permease protein TagG [Candidatus Phycosocius bacilliformis]